MTREEFLARCANAFDSGLCTPERLRLLDRWLDAVREWNDGSRDAPPPGLSEIFVSDGLHYGTLVEIAS